MRYLKRWGLLAAATLMAATGAQAATTVGIRDAIQNAIATNLVGKLAKADDEAARGRALEAASALLPRVIGAVSQGRVFRQNLAAEGLGGGPIAPLIGPYDVFDARVRFTQMVFDLSAIKRYEAAGAGKELAARREEAAREQVAAAAALAYVEALRARKAVAAAQADADLAARLKAQTQDQEKQGTATGVDVVRAQTRLSDASVELLQAQIAERTALIRLKRVAGWPLGDELALSDDLSAAPAEPGPLESALSSAAGARPEVAAALEEARQDALLVSAAKAERAPTVSVGADVGLSGNQPDGGARTTGSIGAGLSIPLFTSGLIKGRVREARAGQDRSEARLADVRIQVEEDVRLAYETLSEAQNQVAASSQTLTLAEQELRMAQDQYAAGTGDNVAVVTAQDELARARNRVVSSLAEDYDARINLAAALGGARGFKL